jgi:hypothetical protein
MSLQTEFRRQGPGFFVKRQDLDTEEEKVRIGLGGQTRKMFGRPRLRSDVRWRITANTLIIVRSIATLVAVANSYLGAHIRRLRVGIASIAGDVDKCLATDGDASQVVLVYDSKPRHFSVH